MVNLNARIYDPTIGRFTNPDPLNPSLYDPQNLNHYSYAENGPTDKSDPTGKDTWSLGLSVSGVAIPGLVAGSFSVYVAADDKGNVGVFVTGGGGGVGGGKLSIGESLSGGVTAGWSNARDIHGLKGPFVSQTVTVGEGVTATGEAFEGTYAGKKVTGGAVTIGTGEGVSMTSGVTGTQELTSGVFPDTLHSMGLHQTSPTKEPPDLSVYGPNRVGQPNNPNLALLLI